jgi:hypothetical protein
LTSLAGLIGPCGAGATATTTVAGGIDSSNVQFSGGTSVAGASNGGCNEHGGLGTSTSCGAGLVNSGGAGGVVGPVDFNGGVLIYIPPR